MIVQLYEATQCYYYRAVLAIFPRTPDQIRDGGITSQQTDEQTDRHTLAVLMLSLCCADIAISHTITGVLNVCDASANNNNSIQPTVKTSLPSMHPRR